MKASSILGRMLRLAASAATSHRGAGPADPQAGRAARPGTADRTRYPGDFTGDLHPVYAPHLDGEPDPGEIVWTWVPYEEDHLRGKDRPVLLVGRDGRWLLALTLSSRDHDVAPARHGERWLDLGTGEWDARRRPSEVRLDRVVRVDPASIRREGAALDRARFDEVAAALGTRRGW